MLIALLHGLAGALLACWAAAHAELSLSAAWAAGWVLVAVAAGLCGLALARRVLPRSDDHLRWDGQAWSLRPASAAGGQTSADHTSLQSLELAMDLGAWLLLRLHPVQGGVLWRTATAHAAGPQWHALRVALQAQGGKAATATAPGGNARGGGGGGGSGGPAA